MAHIHELIDYVVAAYIVKDGKVLLVNHKQLGKWLPIGGHIELDEDSDEALFREINEECGLEQRDIEIIGKGKPNVKDTKFLLAPQFVDIHRINEKHRHLCLTYFAVSKTDRIKFNDEEHNEIKWVSEEELDGLGVHANVKFLAKEAIKKAESM